MEQHIGIIGGGILGIAIARAITLQTGYRVTVLEKESLLASHQTGLNSGVVRAGFLLPARFTQSSAVCTWQVADP
ncbi:FAD-dependent oxidoreductase [Glutamicibacter sp.]|uniref:FAD-dependent oxidoreductase n=1 Tax=Glutamicibacter sp. TaxID=1931995 RepID=UPI002FDFB9CA